LLPPPTRTLSINFNIGWTFISLNIEAADMSIASVFASLNIVPGDQIKNQVAFTNYYADYVRGMTPLAPHPALYCSSPTDPTILHPASSTLTNPLPGPPDGPTFQVTSLNRVC
jgi:hypothetical protein